MPPFQKTIEHDYLPLLVAARSATIIPAEITEIKIETEVAALPVTIKWEDEEYAEPDFKPPAHTFELQMGTTQVQLKSKTIQDRIQLEIAAFGSRHIQQGEQETSFSDGWYEITEATDENPARMLFNNNHYSFESRYRIGYSRLLELRRTAVDRLNATGHWQQIVDSPEDSHQRVIEAVVDKLPRDMTTRVSFDSEGFVRGANRADREEIGIYTERLAQDGVDFKVCHRPLNGSYILINKIRESGDSVATEKTTSSPEEVVSLTEVIDTRKKERKTKEFAPYFGLVALSAGN